MARLKPEHLVELRRLHDETAALVTILTEAGQLGDFSSEFQAVLANTLAAQNLRGMRMVARDMRAMLAPLAPAERASVEAQIALMAGGKPGEAEARDAAAAAAIIERGRVRNDGEYYLLRARKCTGSTKPRRDSTERRLT
jgi:hypothetical protein